MPSSQTAPLRFPASNRSHGASAPVIAGRLFGRLERWAWRLQQRGIEEYLASSQDVFELESRIRGLHRGGR